MKKVTLTKCLDPDRRIQTIKTLRSATRTPTEQIMGLKDAKDIVDDLCKGLAAEVEVFDPALLHGWFTFVETPSDSALGVPRDDVLQFVFDVLSYSDPDDADRIRALPSYKCIREALR